MAVVAIGPSPSSAATTVVPRFRAEGHVDTTTVNGRHALIVRKLLINHIYGSLRIACDRCRRFRGGIRRSAGAHSLGITGANWIITSDRSVLVSVTRRGMVGRFVRLGMTSAHKNRLMTTGSGCMTSTRRVRACPAGAVTTAPTSSSTPAPATAVVFGQGQATAPSQKPAGAATTPAVTTPASPPPPDTAPLDTMMQAVPFGEMQGGTWVFSYISNKPGARFDCLLDAGTWHACDGGSVTESFGLGAHVLWVRAVDAAGNADPTPARHSWTRMPDDGTEYVADDQGPGFSASGSFFTRYDGGGAVNGSYLFFENYLACAGDPYRNSASWTIDGLPNGIYDVYAYIPDNTPSSSGVPGNALAYSNHYTISFRESVADVRSSQSGAGGTWLPLARLGFRGSSTVTLDDTEIQSTCYRKYVIADAIKWVYRFPG